jgi:hypothetical protein
VCSQPLEFEEGLDAVHSRQLYVHQDYVEVGLAELRDRVLAAMSDFNPMTAHLENFGHAFGMVAIVVDDQNSLAHAALPAASGQSDPKMIPGLRAILPGAGWRNG